MLNETCQRIYNQYQRIVGEQSGRPFRYRKNFDLFEDEQPEVCSAVVKISRIFDKHSTINTDLFFRAPFLLHSTEKRHIPIAEYARPRAIADYATCSAALKTSDSVDESIDSVIIASLRYIKDFCLEKNLKLEEYITLENELNHQWIVDYATSHLSKWVLLGIDMMGYDTVSTIRRDCGSDECDMMNLTPYLKNFTEWKKTLIQNQRSYNLVVRGLDQIGKYLEKTIDEKRQMC